MQRKLSVMLEDLRVIYNDCTNTTTISPIPQKLPLTREQLVQKVAEFKEIETRLGPHDIVTIQAKMKLREMIEEMNVTREDAFDIRDSLLIRKVQHTPVEIELMQRRIRSQELRQKQREQREKRKK